MMFYIMVSNTTLSETVFTSLKSKLAKNVHTDDPIIICSYFRFLTSFLPFEEQKRLFDSYVKTNSIDLTAFSLPVIQEDNLRLKAQFIDRIIK